MILHAMLGLTALAASTSAAALPAPKLADVFPGPNPLPEVIEEIPNMAVFNFKAEAVTLSNRNYVNFHVTPYPGAEPAHCFALGTTLSHSLTSIPQTWCYHKANDTTTTTTTTTSDGTTPDNSSSDEVSDDDSNPNTTTSSSSTDHVWFSWTMGDDSATGTDPVDTVRQATGAYLKIVRQGAGQTRDEAIHHFPADLLGYEGDGDLSHQVYTGAQNFTLRALRVQARGSR